MALFKNEQITIGKWVLVFGYLGHKTTGQITAVDYETYGGVCEINNKWKFTDDIQLLADTKEELITQDKPAFDHNTKPFWGVKKLLENEKVA